MLERRVRVAISALSRYVSSRGNAEKKGAVQEIFQAFNNLISRSAAKARSARMSSRSNSGNSATVIRRLRMQASALSVSKG